MPPQRIDLQHHQIPTKANRILYLILIGMLLIAVRLWHLSVIQYDARLQAATKPQQKTIVEPAIRATIRDRFNQPLAINKMAYQATLLYSQLKDIPPFQWGVDADGKKIRVPKRRLYIRELSKKLGHEIGMDPERIEDLIYAKAIYYSQTPFVIKENLSEKEYYRLKILEKEWPGLYARKIPKRTYPLGKIGAELIGYMGAINRPEYEKILHEIKALETFISYQESEFEIEPPAGIQTFHEAKQRLKELEAKAYTMRDSIGKTGIEKAFEENLRGYYGKKIYQTDSKGTILKELSGSINPVPGDKIVLTLSAELQQYAERLLVENEEIRVVKKSRTQPPKKTVMADKQPWIKGGAIVVLDANSAEVLALASYPRIDSNDFVLQGNNDEVSKKKQSIHRWFEGESYIAQLWNQKQPLKRERFHEKKGLFYDEIRWLTWSNYLSFILPLDSPLSQSMDKIKTIEQALLIQEEITKLHALFSTEDTYAILNFLYFGELHENYGNTLKGIDKQRFNELAAPSKRKLDPFFNQLPNNYDKVLIIDLCRLAVASSRFSPSLLQLTGKTTLEEYRQQMGTLYEIMETTKEKTRTLFHEISFQPWRKEKEKEFLKLKRAEEKANKTYAKPYIDYLDQQEQFAFKQFWQTNCWQLILAFLKGNEIENQSEEIPPYVSSLIEWHCELQSTEGMQKFKTLQTTISKLPEPIALEYLKSFRFYEDLNDPLLGRYKGLRDKKNPTGKSLAATFYPIYGYGYGRSYGYRQASTQGSLFKLVTGYEALIQKFNKYQGQILSPNDLNPLVMIDQGYKVGTQTYVGYTEEGKPIPQLYKGGRLPRSLAHEGTGRVDLIRAIEVSSNPYFSLLAGECMEDPEDLCKAARLFSFGSPTGIDLPGEISGKIPTDLKSNRTGLYATAIGQHSLVVTPLQTAVMLATLANGGKVIKPKIIKQIEEESFPFLNQPKKISKNTVEIKNEIFLPEIVRQILLKGLRKATERTYQESLGSLTRLYKEHPEAIREFKEMKEQLLGKTSTSESVEQIDLGLNDGINIYTHVWFGSISFNQDKMVKNKAMFVLKDEFGQPELIVVVYLRYGGYGKEAAPLAAQMIKKWKEINQKHSS